VAAAERNVPSVYAWLEVQVDEAVRAHNLTQAGITATQLGGRRSFVFLVDAGVVHNLEGAMAALGN
jgi:hypothetical protein